MSYLRKLLISMNMRTPRCSFITHKSRRTRIKVQALGLWRCWKKIFHLNFSRTRKKRKAWTVRSSPSFTISKIKVRKWEDFGRVFQNKDESISFTNAYQQIFESWWMIIGIWSYLMMKASLKFSIRIRIMLKNSKKCLFSVMDPKSLISFPWRISMMPFSLCQFINMKSCSRLKKGFKKRRLYNFVQWKRRKISVL